MSKAARAAAWLGTGVLIAGLVSGAAPASAREVTSEQVTELVESASTDPSAIEELATIDSVDGRPVDFEAALEGASSEELEQRLSALEDSFSTSGSATGVDADRAQDAARDVLSQSKFEERDLPRPFQGVLDAIGDALQPIWNWIYGFADDITGGRPELLLGVLGLLVVVLAVVVAQRLIQRKVKSADDTATFDLTRRGPSASELETMAAAAERAGRLEEAIRLEFRAGLMRLAEKGAIPARPSLTSEEIAEHLRSRRVRGSGGDVR